MSEFLLELFSEEIPARMQADAAAELELRITEALKKNELPYESARSFVTARRLVLTVSGLPEAQADISEERKGPSVSAPEQALNGFLRSVGMQKDQLEVRDTPKGQFYFATLSKKGRPTSEVLKEAVESLLHSFPWPKSMRWASHPERWVRPMLSILCLFAGQVVPVEFAGLTAGDKTRGHRFLAPAEFEVRDFADYEQKLRAAYVIIDREERKRIISEDAHALAHKAGLVLHEDEGLLNEVAGLAEWPVPLMGKIDDEFMGVPKEVLMTSMREHQKYFSLLNKDGSLAPRFIVVANMDTADGGEEIVAGNERVLRARLSDAKFFWDTDRKEPLSSKVEKLKARVFHAKLGSVYDKISRMRALLSEILKYVPADAQKADRAAYLCKADLSTGMVGEFPELQGVMGRYYARHDGEDESVCEAIAEHYAPQGPKDACPSSPVSVAVALADKIDTLVGFWLINQKPTGSKDPFALRRAALGVIRLILENGIKMPILEIFHASRSVYGDSITDGVREAMTESEKRKNGEEPNVLTNWSLLQMNLLMGFIADRLKVYLKDRGVRHDYITAVYNLSQDRDIEAVDLVLMLARVRALMSFIGTDDGMNLLTAYRRAANIVRIEEAKDKTSYAERADKTLFVQPEEGALFDALDDVVINSSKKIAEDDFEGAMEVLARLRSPVDAFFEKVQVNCEDVQLRCNRLRLLSEIVGAMGGVADFSAIEG